MCLSCLEDYSLVLTQCVPKYSQCLKGTYLKDYSCKPCRSTCTSCSDGLTCDECPSGSYLSNQQCIRESSVTCGPGSFLASNRLCVQCESPCSTCTDKNNCLTCRVGYQLTGSSCTRANSNLKELKGLKV